MTMSELQFVSREDIDSFWENVVDAIRSSADRSKWDAAITQADKLKMALFSLFSSKREESSTCIHPHEASLIMILHRSPEEVAEDLISGGYADYGNSESEEFNRLNREYIEKNKDLTPFLPGSL